MGFSPDSAYFGADMLSDTCVKQQNKIGKIFKNSKFHFFKIEPKLGKTNL